MFIQSKISKKKNIKLSMVIEINLKIDVLFVYEVYTSFNCRVGSAAASS